MIGVLKAQQQAAIDYARRCAKLARFSTHTRVCACLRMRVGGASLKGVGTQVVIVHMADAGLVS